MKHDYTTLDNAIKAALATGPKKFRELENEPEIKLRGIKIAAAHNASALSEKHELKPWVFIARRLTSLEVRGQIRNDGNAVGYRNIHQ